jgi:hypothetical protein
MMLPAYVERTDIHRVAVRFNDCACLTCLDAETAGYWVLGWVLGLFREDRWVSVGKILLLE